MRLNVRLIADRGDLEKERVVFDVQSSLDIGAFLLLQTRYVNDAVYAKVYNTYWFPDGDVDAGDTVVVYTKDGIDREDIEENGKTVHFFYWGLDAPIWDSPNRAPVIAQTRSWKLANSPLKSSI